MVATNVKTESIPYEGHLHTFNNSFMYFSKTELHTLYGFSEI